jgi:hypothetical protein
LDDGGRREEALRLGRMLLDRFETFWARTNYKGQLHVLNYMIKWLTEKEEVTYEKKEYTAYALELSRRRLAVLEAHRSPDPEWDKEVSP